MSRSLASVFCGIILLGAACSGSPEPDSALDVTDQSESSSAEVDRPETGQDRREEVGIDDSERAEEPVIPDDWLPVPELSDSTLADNPLLLGMNLPGLSSSDPELAPYSALIGVSRYVLVDGTGDPIETGSDDYRQRTMTIWAYHGSQQPFVYWLTFTPSFLHDENGYQTKCVYPWWVLFRSLPESTTTGSQPTLHSKFSRTDSSSTSMTTARTTLPPIRCSTTRSLSI